MTAVYVHIPYCKSKCSYCDFASEPFAGDAWPYLQALKREAANVSRTFESVDTLYVGGGTPSVLTPEQILWLFEHLRRIFQVSPGAEVTFEANPCSLSAAKSEALSGAGVNRVSLGAQSFVDSELAALGRSHEAADISRGLSILRQCRIKNVSLDLIYAIPGQSPESWRYSLAQAVKLRPEHISTYCLTFEPETPFWDSLREGEIERKTDEQELELYEIGRKMLVRAGYEHYEISNFSRSCMRSLHNSVYWSNSEYLGLGAGAVSYLNGTRASNVRAAQEYIRAVENRGGAECEREDIALDMQLVETVIQQLRTREGIDCEVFKKRFDVCPSDVFGSSFRELVDLGLLEITPKTIRASLKGWHLANEVAMKILP